MIPCLTKKTCHIFSVFSKPILRFPKNDFFFMKVSKLRLYHLLNNILFFCAKRTVFCSNICGSVTNDHFIIYLNKPFVKLQVYRIYKMMWLLPRRSLQINIAYVHKITDEVVLCSFATLDKYTFRLICIGVRPNILRIFMWMKVCRLRCQIKLTDIVLLWIVMISKKWRFFRNKTKTINRWKKCPIIVLSPRLVWIRSKQPPYLASCRDVIHANKVIKSLRFCFDKLCLFICYRFSKSWQCYKDQM